MSKARNQHGRVIHYCRTFPGRWPGVSEWIEVFVDNYYGRWDAYGSIGVPNEEREQWSARKTFATLEEAAVFAADFVAFAEELVASVDRGESPWMPHRAMREACRADLDRDPRLIELSAAVSAGTERRSALEMARRNAEHDWYRAHDWRDYRSPTSATRSSA